MDLLVRYSEIHKKKGKTRQQLVQTLRQRIQDRLNYDGTEFSKVSTGPGRIKVIDTEEQAKTVSQLPGVKSCSLTTRTDPTFESVKNSIDLDVGDSFGVRVKSRTQQSTQEWERKIGSFIQEETGAEVDLDDPDTWVKIELDEEAAYIYSNHTTFEGPGGLPAASQGGYAALISGGIDSPVAAFQILKRGSDIFPVYFYNRPYAAEDHLIRFEQVIKELKKLHSGKKWSYAFCDLKEVNEALSEVGKGRMVLHRRLMFEVAEKIREEKDLQGIVTGESLAQKSSQTPQNLFMTSKGLPVLRPLIGWNKNDITQKARKMGTFQYSQIDSACQNISPDSPSTEMTAEKFNKLKSKVGFDELVESAFEQVEYRNV